jgi:hypothetical protein
MHILHAKHAVIGNTEDPTSYSYSISKYDDLVQSPAVCASLNSFKYQLFISDASEDNPYQPFISFARFLTLLRDRAGEDINRLCLTGRDSFPHLLSFFNSPK